MLAKPSIITYQIILNRAQRIQSDSNDFLADVCRNIGITIDLNLVSTQQTSSTIENTIGCGDNVPDEHCLPTLTASTRRQITYVEPALDSILNTAIRGTTDKNDIQAVNNSPVVASIAIQTQGIEDT